MRNFRAVLLVACVVFLLCFAGLAVFLSMSGAVEASGINSGAVAAVICDESRPVGFAAAATHEIVPAAAGKSIQVCSIMWESDAVNHVTVVYGTGALCAVGQVALTGSVHTTGVETIQVGAGVGRIMGAPTGNALCMIAAQATDVAGFVTFRQAAP